MVRSYPIERRAVRVEDWPESDRSAWDRATRSPDPLDLIPAPAAHLRPATRRQYENGYGRWLTWLQTTGLLDETASPGARATEERVRKFYDALQEDGLAPYSVADRLVSLAQVLRSIEPDMDFDWIAQAARRVHRAARPIKDLAVGLPATDELFQLGLDLMEEADGGRFRYPLDRALLYRDGLIIALLAKRPMRGKNLASIEIGEQLQRAGTGWRLAFRGDEIKNGRPYTCSWPDDLNHALQYYLDRIRPILARGGRSPPAKHLWLSTVGGNAMRPGDINVRVKLWTTERFGRAVTPHRFRHAAATTVATASPENVEDIAAILGHTTMKTSTSHYNLATALEAADRCQKVVSERRRHLGQRKAPSTATLPLFRLLEIGAREPATTLPPARDEALNEQS